MIRECRGGNPKLSRMDVHDPKFQLCPPACRDHLKGFRRKLEHREIPSHLRHDIFLLQAIPIVPIDTSLSITIFQH